MRALALKAIFAGLLGGMLAGLCDGGATLLSGAGTLALAGRVRLVLWDGGLGALAGCLLAAVFVLVAMFGRSRRVPPERAAVLVASPILVYDAFAMFGGVQAARIPAHHALSLVLAVLGGAGVLLLAKGWTGLLGHLESSTSGFRRRKLLVALVLVLFAVALGHANRVVLPRLYPWFHLSLSAVYLALWLLVARLFLARAGRAIHRWLPWGGIAGALGSLLFACWLEGPVLAASQSLRFYMFEKTRVASVLLRLLPTRRVSQAQVGLAVDAQDLPRLPAGPHRPDADVVLITVDAVRADHLGSYGYPRPTSPNLDALAARGVRFARAYTQAPHTSFSLASVMIGKYYPTLARLAPSDTHETLAAILRRYGWKTAAFFPPAVFYIDAHKMKAFESSNFDFEYVKYEYLDGDARVGQIEDFLEAENPRKLFLWLHLFEPHEPYEHHAGFDFGMRDMDRYDSEIAYADKVVGKVIAMLAKKRPGAIVIVAADHGEEFGEHGGRYHGTTLYEEQTHVPFLVVVPGLTPHVVAGPTQLIDIPSTVLGLLDLPVPARMRGTDLGPWLASPAAPVERLPPAFAEVEDKRMVVVGTEKLICNVSRDYCSYFDLAEDAREEHDRADARPERVAILRAKLNAWLEEQARFETKLLGAAGSQGSEARLIERGRLGEASAALGLAAMLLGNAPVASRREAASLLVTALPPQAQTQTALLAAANGASDSETRAWAAIAAMRAGADTMKARVRALLAGQAAEQGSALCVYAALALAESADSAGCAVLTTALDTCDSDVSLCKRILAALGKLGDTCAVPGLVAHLPFVQTRRETVLALAAIPDPTSVAPLVECLKEDTYVPVRVAAALALGHLGGARAVQALEWSIKHESEAAVLAAVRQALGALGRR